MEAEVYGLVVKSTGSSYLVSMPDGEIINCRIRGKMRLKQFEHTNPVAVGDRVCVARDGDDAVITQIAPRQNYMVRRSVNLSKRSHIIAANIDQLFLIVTLEQPETSTTFIDRICVGAEAFHIPVYLIFNKTDIYSPQAVERMEQLKTIYAAVGYGIFQVSAHTGAGLESLAAAMAGKTTLFSGHSGVGKSTLVNKLEPGLNLKTLAVSESHQSGQHTTTFAQMHPYHLGGFIVDTPGIKGFGLIDIAPDELAGYFPEMRRLLPDCKFYNCLHLNEPGCAVRQAMEDGAVAVSRYESYLTMYYNKENDYRA